MTYFIKSLFILMAVLVTVAGAQERWYKYEVGKPYTYVGELKENVQQIAMGQTVNVKTETNTSYSITVLEYLEDGSLKAQLDVKSAVAFSEGPGGLKTFGDDLTNKSYSFTIDAEGHVSDIDSSVNEVTPQSQGLVNIMADFLPDLPADKLQDGESWTVESTDTTSGENRSIIIQRETEYEIDGTTDVNGTEAMNITLEGEVSIEGELSTGRQDLTIMGEGTYEGYMYMSKELGVVLKNHATAMTEEVYTPPSNPQAQATVTRTRETKVELIME